jgi:hypothetical protein
MTLQERTELIEYLDQLVLEGKEVKLGWEGGGDSGWCWFEVDGEKIGEHGEDKKIDALVDYMNDYLDYGSWAGEYSANGEAVYDIESKSFTGTDHYGEDDTEDYDCDIKIRIPKSLWFDQFEIAIEGSDCTVNSTFHMINGFTTPEHTKFALEFDDLFQNQLNEVATKFDNDPDQNEFAAIWHNFDLMRSDFENDGDDLLYQINSIPIGTRNDEEKEIFLDLLQLNVTQDAE